MDFEVNRTDFRRTRLVDEPPRPLRDGQIRLKIQRFAFTSNNISYALSGDMLDYWGFFPTQAPWGRLPAMGLSTVSESANPDIAVGGRYFGFHPLSTELCIDAVAAGSGFRDVGAHRAEHAPAYVTFTDVAGDPGFRDEFADEYLLLRGLFMTSFLVDDFLDDNDRFGAVQVLVTSASSKTSIALAHCLHERGVPAVGITSSRNVDFVESLGTYASVVTYDDIESLDRSTASVVVDMAGNADVRRSIHEHFADSLGYSCQVGATHWERARSGGTPLPGPKPEFFFAPGQMVKRNRDWGLGELERRIGEAFTTFVEGSSRWLHVRRSAGPDAMTSVYAQMLEGQTSPDIGHVLSLDPAAFTD